MCGARDRRRLTLPGQRNAHLRTTARDCLAEGKWPPWWAWELELSPHLLKRMTDRSFNEVDLRRMLEKARGVRKDVVEGGWVVDAIHRDAPWEVIVEPDESVKLIVVVTAYPVQP